MEEYKIGTMSNSLIEKEITNNIKKVAYHLTSPIIGQLPPERIMEIQEWAGTKEYPNHYLTAIGNIATYKVIGAGIGALFGEATLGAMIGGISRTGLATAKVCLETIIDPVFPHLTDDFIGELTPYEGSYPGRIANFAWEFGIAIKEFMDAWNKYYG